MSLEEAIKVYGSDEILMHPDGSYELKVLEKILYDATLYNLNKNSSIITTHEQRVKNFDPDKPEWEKIEYNVSLQSLFNLYKEMEGTEYKQPTLDELQSKHKTGWGY